MVLFVVFRNSKLPPSIVFTLVDMTLLCAAELPPSGRFLLPNTLFKPACTLPPTSLILSPKPPKASPTLPIPDVILEPIPEEKLESTPKLPVTLFATDDILSVTDETADIALT